MTITVSGGPGDAAVPAVAGMPQDEAEQALEDAGFKTRVERVFSDDVRNGRVIGTSPPAGTTLERGSEVTLQVSRGPEQVEVPDVTGDSEDNARSALEGAGLRVGKITREESDEAPGTVIEQSPAAGEEVDKGDAVDLTVAQGDADPRRGRPDRGGGAGRARGRGLRGDRARRGDHRPGGRGHRARPDARGRRGAPSGQPGDDRRRPRRGGDGHALADHGAMRVAVLAGGRSSEHEVSLSSAAFVREAVAAAGHEVLPVTIERSGAWTHDGETLALSPGGGLLGADAVFPVLHGPFGEDGTVQGLLELLDVPYVGAGVLASSLCMDKVVFKEVLAAAAVPQVPSAAVREHRWRTEPDAVRHELTVLGTPVFVKPARLGSSVGISKVWSEARDGRGARRRLRARQPGHRRGLLRRHGGRVLGDGARRAAGLRAGRDRDPQGRLVRLHGQVRRRRDGARGARAAAGDRRARRCGGSRSTPSSASAAPAWRASTSSSRATACCVNELNTMPGFTATSAFPKLWEASGVPPAELCDRLLGFALERFESERSGHEF